MGNYITMCKDNHVATLTQLGWTGHFEEHFAPFAGDGMAPGRIIREDRNLYQLAGEDGQLMAEVSGRLRNNALSRADFPAVGDWVVMHRLPQEDKAIIHALLPRRSCFSRKAVLSGGMPDTGGKGEEQVLAANVDTVFLVSGLDADFNIRRIERYVTVAYNSSAVPVIILNKADLCEDIDDRLAEVESVAMGVDVHALSAATGNGLESLRKYLPVGKTVAFLGSSGVGKSTIINGLLDEERLKTNAVREYDNRGRHTTTHRELVVLPDGGVVIDTPGMREIQLWSDDDGLKRAFDDIESLAQNCRFHDCSHSTEPGCSVRAALENGELDQSRFGNYLKLQKEIAHLARRQDIKTRRSTERARDKRFRQYFKDRKKIDKKLRSR